MILNAILRIIDNRVNRIIMRILDVAGLDDIVFLLRGELACWGIEETGYPIIPLTGS